MPNHRLDLIREQTDVLQAIFRALTVCNWTVIKLWLRSDDDKNLWDVEAWQWTAPIVKIRAGRGLLEESVTIKAPHCSPPPWTPDCQALYDRRAL